MGLFCLNNYITSIYSSQNQSHHFYLKLSQNVILGLHQIIQTVQQCDYHGGLQIYNQMVSHANFSEISNFMPGLKMLLQSANQLQVYVK